MKWQRTALLVVFSTLLVGAATGTVAAQDDGSGVEQCDPDSDDFVSCLREHASAEDVRDWVQKSPDELTDNQVSAVVEVNVSSLNDTAESRINEWRSWSAGGDRPDWFGDRDSAGNDTDSSDSEDAPTEKYREIRTGQWFVEEPEWYENGTAKAVVYSEYDGKVAFVDNRDCSGKEQYCQPDVVQADVTAGEVTTVHFEATNKPGTFGKPDQKVTFNSLIGPGGEYSLAIASMSDEGSHLFAGDPIWDYVWVAVLTVIFTLSGESLATYAYIYWSDRRLEQNLFEYLREEF